MWRTPFGHGIVANRRAHTELSRHDKSGIYAELGRNFLDQSLVSFYCGVRLDLGRSESIHIVRGDTCHGEEQTRDRDDQDRSVSGH